MLLNGKFFCLKRKNALEGKEIDLLMRSGILCCREILFDSLLPPNAFEHTKENISEAILAQLEKRGNLVKSSSSQLTQDHNKNSRAYYDKTFYTAECLPKKSS